jgi:hypothetical protein
MVNANSSETEAVERIRELSWADIFMPTCIFVILT